MLSDITTGNTITDGTEFGYWFVGQIDQWCKEKNIPFDPKRFGLRHSKVLEAKWGKEMRERYGLYALTEPL
jgi:hypothetical protein